MEKGSLWGFPNPDWANFGNENIVYRVFFTFRDFLTFSGSNRVFMMSIRSMFAKACYIAQINFII